MILLKKLLFTKITIHLLIFFEEIRLLILQKQFITYSYLILRQFLEEKLRQIFALTSK